MCETLKVKRLSSSDKTMMGYIEDLNEVWDALNICLTNQRNTAKALEPIIKYRKCRKFDHAGIEELYSLLRSTMIGVKWVNLLRKLKNEQTLPGIMGRMSPADSRQWAKEMPS